MLYALSFVLCCANNEQCCLLLRLLHLQESMEATSKALEELQEQLAATKQAAADEASKATEAHALELQKMQVERTKLEVRRQPRTCALLGQRPVS
jgi:cell envelope opacity-associated protein A